MTTLCPEFDHAQQTADTARASQFPACGVAYANAEDAAMRGKARIGSIAGRC